MVPSEEDARSPAEAPVITLGSLETKSCVDELSDGVQSMDVRWGVSQRRHWLGCSYHLLGFIREHLHAFEPHVSVCLLFSVLHLISSQTAPAVL